MRARTRHGNALLAACAAAAAAAGLALATASGACGAALVDVDAGRDSAEDTAEDTTVADDADPPDTESGCGTVWYFDGDGDTWGDPDATVCACAQPSSYVERPRDCCDANGTVHPDQIGWFASAFDQCGSPSFDYDCSTVEEPEPAAVGGHCSGVITSCDLVVGWEGATAPACGAAAPFVTGCLAGAVCLPEHPNRTQACH